MSTVVTLVRRELRLEASGREATSTVLPFVLAAVLLAGLAMGPSRELLRAVAPGVIWLVVLFAAPALARSVAAAEREDGTWDTLRGLVPPVALLAGKIGGLWLHYLVTWAVAAALVTVMFPAPMPLPGLVAGPVGTLGLAGLTVAFGSCWSGAAAPACWPCCCSRWSSRCCSRSDLGDLGRPARGALRRVRRARVRRWAVHRPVGE
jgi:heme exporter protein B